MEVAPMVERVEVVFDNLGVLVTTVGGDHVDWFVVEKFGEKVADGVLGEPVGDVLADRRIHQVIVECESVGALPVDAEILFVVGVDTRILREIVLDDLPRIVGDPVAELLVERTETEVDGADVLKVFERRVGERVHDASQPLDFGRIPVTVFNRRNARRERPTADRTQIALHPHGRTPVRVARVGSVLGGVD